MPNLSYHRHTCDEEFQMDGHPLNRGRLPCKGRSGKPRSRQFRLRSRPGYIQLFYPNRHRTWSIHSRMDLVQQSGQSRDVHELCIDQSHRRIQQKRHLPQRDRLGHPRACRPRHTLFPSHVCRKHPDFRLLDCRFQRRPIPRPGYFGRERRCRF